MGNDDLRYWLGFSAFHGIGPLRFKLLKDYFGSVKSAWTASEKTLRETELGDALSRKFASFRRTFSPDAYIEEIKSKKITVLTLEDPQYPAPLAEQTGAPFLIYQGKS